MTDRAQTFTMEAFVAAILLLATVAFALQAVAISTNTASGADAELRGQHAALADGVLDRAVDRGELRRTLVYWDETEAAFLDADPEDGYYVAEPPNTTFGDSLEAAFAESYVRYNVDLYYRTADGDRERQRLVESGTPSADAVRAVETVTLYNDTVLVDEDESDRPGVTLGEIDSQPNATFYAPDAAPDSALYNVVRVEVIVWRT